MFLGYRPQGQDGGSAVKIVAALTEHHMMTTAVGDSTGASTSFGLHRNCVYRGHRLIHGQSTHVHKIIKIIV